MRRLIKHLGIIHNDLAGSCLDFIINLVTTSVQSATPDNAIASMSVSPTNSATFVLQINPQGAEYTAILELSSTPSGPLDMGTSLGK